MESTSLHPNMCFLHWAYMDFSQWRSWSSKGDWGETLSLRETKPGPPQTWLQQSWFSTQPTKYDQREKGLKSTETYPHWQQLHCLEFKYGCCVVWKRKFSSWISSQGSFTKQTITNAPFPTSAYRTLLIFIVLPSTNGTKCQLQLQNPSLFIFFPPQHRPTKTKPCYCLWKNWQKLSKRYQKMFCLCNSTQPTVYRP